MSEQLDPRVRPQFAKGPLTKVGWARNQAEAELIEGLLLEQGIPSLVRRSGGFDVPDFLAAGPRDILVPATGAALARELLGTAEPTEPVGRAGVGQGARRGCGGGDRGFDRGRRLRRGVLSQPRLGRGAGRPAEPVSSKHPA